MTVRAPAEKMFEWQEAGELEETELSTDEETRPEEVPPERAVGNTSDAPESAIYKTHETADAFRYELWGNDTRRADELAHTLADEIIQYQFGREEDRAGLVIAMAEALYNAILHGNLEVDSSLKEVDFEPFHEEVRRRRQDAEFQVRNVIIEASFSLSEARITIRDQGEGFDPDTVVDPAEAPADQLHGRGLAMIRAFVDEVAFNEAGNAITLVIRRE